jgi:CheY-like chemotaxis protein/Tfp pilus assembly protein PilZ
MREGTSSLGGETRLDLHYRSAKAFLLAYASQLSMGELFLETPNPWPLATPLKLRLHVNGVGDLPPFELSGAVAWTRPGPIGPGQPAGMGISLLSTIDGGGERIDALVGRYTRTKIWVATTDSAGRAILGRYLQSLMTCEILADGPVTHPRGELASPQTSRGATDGGLHHSVDAATATDLVIIDFDAPGVTSIDSMIHDLKNHELSSGAPIVVLAQSERDRTRAAALGVDEILPNPPSLQELQSAVMHLLSRPIAWTLSPPP